MLIEHMAIGMSFESFAGIIGVCEDTIYEWAKVHKDFSEAKRHAFARNRVFWEQAGISGLYMGGKENPFNSTVWVFNMKNRFGWRDTKEVDANVVVSQIKITKDEETL
jgi:hypothetical protein